MPEQPGTSHHHLHASWHAAHRPFLSCSIAPQRHIHSCTRRASRAVSSLDGGARRCAAEAPTLTEVLHRWQSSRARPSSASRPAGTQRIGRSGHVASRRSGTSTHVQDGHREPLAAWTVVHVDVRLKHPRLLRYSNDGKAVGRVLAVPPAQLARSTSVVLVM